MMIIDIVPQANDLFEVTVHSKTKSRHSVTLSDEYANKLVAGKITKNQLIRFSFEFLLEREPNTSILKSFDLHEITNYFPEFQSSVKSLVESSTS